MTARYEVHISIESDAFHGMKDVLDTLCNALERRGLTEADYEAEINGPAELRITSALR